MVTNTPKQSPPRKPKQYRRQILAGDAVRPMPDPWERPEGTLAFTTLQRYFLILALVLLLIGGVLIWQNLVLLSTVPLFLLAMLLVASRFFF